MATKKINGLFMPFNQLYKRNVFMVDAITKRTYATTDEVDQVTHTGQVRCPWFNHKKFYLQDITLYIQVTKFM